MLCTVGNFLETTGPNIFISAQARVLPALTQKEPATNHRRRHHAKITSVSKAGKSITKKEKEKPQTVVATLLPVQSPYLNSGS